MPHCSRIQVGDLVKVAPLGDVLAVVLHEYLHKPWVRLQLVSGGYPPQLYDSKDVTLVSKAAG